MKEKKKLAQTRSHAFARHHARRRAIALTSNAASLLISRAAAMRLSNSALMRANSASNFLSAVSAMSFAKHSRKAQHNTTTKQQKTALLSKNRSQKSAVCVSLAAGRPQSPPTQSKSRRPRVKGCERGASFRMQSQSDNLRRKRRKELEGFYTDSARQQAFFKVFFPLV